MPEFDPDREEVLSRARQIGVRSLLCPADAASPASLGRTLDLSERFPWIAAAAGVHPHQAKAWSPECLDGIRELARRQKICAIGEIGLDYHYHFSPPEKQREALRAQLDLAESVSLPVIIHSREAGADILAALADARFSKGGVLHCFTEDWETARRVLDLGFSVSFSGILTYASTGQVREVAARLPDDRLLIETDSPFLAPAPRRGKAVRNEPAFVIETARCLAGIRRASLEELAALTLRNFRSLFQNSAGSSNTRLK
jgi:TatD DNase family protein